MSIRITCSNLRLKSFAMEVGLSRSKLTSRIGQRRWQWSISRQMWMWRGGCEFSEEHTKETLGMYLHQNHGESIYSWFPASHCPISQLHLQRENSVLLLQILHYLTLTLSSVSMVLQLSSRMMETTNLGAIFFQMDFSSRSLIFIRFRWPQSSCVHPYSPSSNNLIIPLSLQLDFLLP